MDIKKDIFLITNMKNIKIELKEDTLTDSSYTIRSLKRKRSQTATQNMTTKELGPKNRTLSTNDVVMRGALGGETSCSSEECQSDKSLDKFGKFAPFFTHLNIPIFNAKTQTNSSNMVTSFAFPDFLNDKQKIQIRSDLSQNTTKKNSSVSILSNFQNSEELQSQLNPNLFDEMKELYLINNAHFTNYIQNENDFDENVFFN